MKVSFCFIAFFSLFLISACSSLTVEPMVTPSATTSLTSTLTPIPTMTDTLTPTVTFTSTATPTKTWTPTMTPTPTRVFFGMNTPFPADQLELTVLKAWLTDEGITVTIPKVRLNYIEPEFAYLLVRINVSGLDGATIGMEFVQRELFVQFADKETINCRVIIVGGIDNASAVIKGIMPGSKIGTLPENFSGLYKDGVADYMFWLTYEPDLNDELYLYWGETPPVKLILTVEE